MMRAVAAVLALIFFTGIAPPVLAAGAYDFRFEAIDGGPLPLSEFRGRTVLIVNTASRCGYTPQYEGLQALFDRYRDQGFVVLGVPSNDFNQELATEAEIKQFCEVNFAVDFPLTAKTHVKGPEAHPFYRWVAAKAGAPRWNFHKYLIVPDGSLVGAFSTQTKPDDPEITKAIEKIL